MNLKLKIFLFGFVPVALALSVVTYSVQIQAGRLIEQQVSVLEAKIIEEKQRALRDYIELALTSIAPIARASSQNGVERSVVAKEVELVLSSLEYSEDGYFFVYDMQGNNVVHPRQPWRVGRNWINVQDNNGVFLIRELIQAAQNGGGFVPYLWERPTTGELSRKLGYAEKVGEFDWMIGTGVYLDEIDELVATLQSDVETAVTKIFATIWGLFALSVLGVGISISFIAYRETSFADTKLRALYNELVDVQEDERARVSRDLHDSLSQLLVSVKYAIELARTKLKKRYQYDGTELDNGLQHLSVAVQEVRRISADLRPKDLDDLGLAAALRSLGERFESSTSLKIKVNVVQVNDLISEDKKSALYRIAQECLTNIERHANATNVEITLTNNRKKVRLIISDDGDGIAHNQNDVFDFASGLGIKNMQERMATFNGQMEISNNSISKGLTLVAELPVDTRFQAVNANLRRTSV